MNKMKKFLCFALTMCLFLSACGNDSNLLDSNKTGLGPAQPTLGFDAQNKYLLARACSFQETDTIFFGSSFTGNYIQYYDKSSGLSGVLCPDPACTHDSTDCGAYVQSGGTLSYYNGKLYWVAKDIQSGNDYFLWRGDLSGTNREKVKRISYENVIIPYQPQQYVIHRGKLYILGQASIVTGALVSLRVSFLSMSLDDSDDFTVLYDESFDSGIQSAARFAGEHAYLSVISFPEGGPYDLTITKFDVESGDSRLVYTEAKMKEVPGDIWVTEQEEVYLPGYDAAHAYIWKLEKGARTEIFSSRNTHSSVPKVLDGIAVNTYSKNNIRWIEIVRLTGETVYNGKLFLGEIQGLEGDPNGYSFAVIGADDEKVILNLQNFTETGLFDYMIMLDLHDNLKPTVLWSTQ